MLLRNNIDIEYSQEEFDYFKSLKNSRNPSNKSQIIVINFSDEDLASAIVHRDVYHVDEIESDLPKRAIEAMGIEYIKFCIVLSQEAGVPVLEHFHFSNGNQESHFQPVACLSPTNSIDGLWVNDRRYDISGHNNILLNVKMPHWVEAQKEPAIYVTSFCARLG